MRTILTAIFATAMAAVPALSKAAPRNIDECEKIQAADAYNHCLALFGPIARGHRSFADSAGNGTQEAKATSGSVTIESAAAENTPRGKRYASKRAWTKNRWVRHAKGQRAKAVSHRYGSGRNSAMAFSVVSGRTRLR